jgi:hypothetical protein
MAQPYSDVLITIGGASIPREDERQHFKIIGADPAPAIDEILAGALHRQDIAVVADIGGKHIERHYKPSRDVILSPTDPRSARWNPFNEIQKEDDASMLAGALISGPSPKTSFVSVHENTNHLLARAFVADTLERLWKVGNHDRQELGRFLSRAPHSELKVLLKGAASEALFYYPERLEKIRAIASSRTRWMNDLDKTEAPSLSIREWTQRDHAGQGGAIFIHDPAGAPESYRRLIPTLMAASVHGALHRKPGPENRPIWFMHGKCSQADQLESMADALSRLPSYEGRIVLGIQSLDELKLNQHQETVIAILKDTGNTLIAGSDTGMERSDAKFAAYIIDRGRDPALPNRIEQLSKNEGYLLAASARSWQTVTLPQRESLPPDIPRSDPKHTLSDKTVSMIREASKDKWQQIRIMQPASDIQAQDHTQGIAKPSSGEYQH